MKEFERVLDLIYQIKNKPDLKDFFIGLTTPYERKVFARRVEIVKRLLAGEDQHSIAADLRVGVSTVSRGARELKRGHFRIMGKSKV